ncbi:MAG: hypothetical protein CME63_10355 [Halobacteriovoraceae bacterium]|nr:hypothetical protein [Halobacteriovoraceae bacterium]|tara:strand:+ start:31684 stop:32136 length:453 start_codon:yes stop_codon:yes gene_type:complete
MTRGVKDSMSQFEIEHLKKMKQGIQYFNEAKYWECHEELEDHWLEDMGDNARYVYWTIIQVATSLYHYEDGNLAGARGMMNKARDKISKCRMYGVESEIMNKFLQWKLFTKLVSEVPTEPSLDDFKKISQFKFSRPDKWDVHIKKMESKA